MSPQAATPPATPESERDARIARWIQQMLSVMLLAYLVFFTLGKVRSIAADYVSTTQYGVLACLLLLWLLKRGHNSLAGAGLVLTPIITVNSELLLSSIEPFQVWQAGVIISIPMAGLIFSNRATLWVLLLNLLGIGVTVTYWLLWPPAASNTNFLMIRAVGAVIFMLSTALFSMRTVTYLTQTERAETRARRDAETRNAQLAQLLLDNTRLRAREAQAAALAERQRIAREMHDSISQSLYGIVMAARTLTHPDARGSALADEAARYIQQLSDSALSEMRALIFELRPEALATHGLRGALRHQAGLLAPRSNAAIVLELGTEEPEIDPPAQEALYRIGMEALNNAIKHAQAGTITLSLTRARDRVALSVNDDGIGFDPARAGALVGHFGLQTMRERAEQHGGSLVISSQPGHGTLVRATVQAR